MQHPYASVTDKIAFTFVSELFEEKAVKDGEGKQLVLTPTASVNKTAWQPPGVAAQRRSDGGLASACVVLRCQHLGLAPKNSCNHLQTGSKSFWSEAPSFRTDSVHFLSGRIALHSRSLFASFPLAAPVRLRSLVPQLRSPEDTLLHKRCL